MQLSPLEHPNTSTGDRRNWLGGGAFALLAGPLALGFAACAVVPAEPPGGQAQSAGTSAAPGEAPRAGTGPEAGRTKPECDPELAPVTTAIFGGRVRVRLPVGASVETMQDGQARVLPAHLSPEGCAHLVPDARIDFVRLGHWPGVMPVAADSGAAAGAAHPELLRDVLVASLGYEGRSSIAEQTIEGVSEAFRLEAVLDIHASPGRPDPRRGLIIMRAFEGDVFWMILETPAEYWTPLEATLQAVARSMQIS